MANFTTTSSHSAPGDNLLTDTESSSGSDLATLSGHPMDSDEARKEHKMLLNWYYYEKEKQSPNRMEMSMDHDFYDSIQWDPTDVAELESRGQMPLVYNEIAPMIDWLIGTERRTRVDWKVLPRAEDDVDMADVKTKVMKYVSDINHVQFVRSRAAADAFKGGIGWVDDGARDDPTQDRLYSKYEDWRNVIWDSDSYELDLSDARYLFRWRWVDEDVAVMMIPGRADRIRAAVENAQHRGTSGMFDDELDLNQSDPMGNSAGMMYSAGSSVMVDAKRRKVKVIEGQYRKPVKVQVVDDGPHRGTILDPRDSVMADAIGRSATTIVDKVMMQVHVAVFTESDMLDMGPSGYRHNKFSLTPIWCYRYNRNRQPYGAVRRVRDLQRDLNKRASKALFLLNTNQIIADENAVKDWDAASDEVSRPDGRILKKPGSEFTIRRDTDAATGQLQMMTMDAQSIQKSAGVSQENMGRQTNAVSGEAIKARQLQGSVVTTEPFDNIRYATQIQGEKQLSLTEQFYTEEKVIRLTGNKGALEWVRINTPEVQPDGSTRYLNDITASAADFVCREQDYSGTLRAAMFESLNEIAGRLPPEVALRLLTLAFEYSDLPNKDKVAEQIRKLTGEQDPNKKLTPEEEQQQADQKRQQQEAMQMQRETALQVLEEQRAKVRLINVQAAKLESEADGQGGDPAMQAQISQVRAEAAAQIDSLTQQLTKAQSELANRTLQINREADTKHALANIDRDTKLQVAEIQARSDDKMTALEEKIDALEKSIKNKSPANKNDS